MYDQQQGYQYGGYAQPRPVAEIDSARRAQFVTRTYQHLFFAILGFVLVEMAIFQTGVAYPVEIMRAVADIPNVVGIKAASARAEVYAEIWDALAELKCRGLAQVVIDKNVDALLELADRHFVMEKGRVVWSGASRALHDQQDIVNRYLGV